MILKSAEDKLNCVVPIHFTKNARTAWGHILQSVIDNRKKNIKVLLPSYIGYTDREGSGVFDPIEKTNVDYTFYTVGERLEVDMVDFERKLRSSDVDVVLIIHYFGFCRNNMSEIKSLCEKHEVVLVEDCAHAFHLGRQNQTIGKFGDFSFYSLHKYIASGTGGAFQVNNTLIPINPVPVLKKASVDVLEQYIRTDFEKVAQIRRANYIAYERAFAGIDGVEVMYNIESEDDIPQTFAIKVKKGLREKLYFYLMEQNMPTVALYYRLKDVISADMYPLSYTIAGEILNLPVHQDTNISDVELLTQTIIKFLAQNE